MLMCMYVCVFLCVPYGAVVLQSISNREVAGSIPDDYGRTHLSSLSHSLALLSFSWVVTNSQCMPEYVVWCVCRKRKK